MSYRNVAYPCWNVLATRLTAYFPMRGRSLRSTRSDTDTLLLDFDGTICATAPAIRFSLETAFSQLCGEIPSPNRVKTAIRSGLTLRETIRILHPNSNISHEEILQLEHRYRDVYSSEGYRYEVLFPGAEATLEECARQAEIIILSNKGHKAIEAAIGRFALGQYVSAVLAERPGTPGKPHAQLFDEVQQRVPGIRRHRSLVVGDSETDLRFARNACLSSCWAIYGYGHIARCRAVGFDYVLDQLESLPTILQDWLVQRGPEPEFPKI